MKLGLAKDQSEVQLRLTLRQAVFHEIWLAEALKMVWEIWTRMGWFTDQAHRVYEDDWRTFRLNEHKHEIVKDITHFNRLVKRSSFNFERDFDDGWSYIVRIIAMIQNYNLCFQASPEVNMFRQTVNLFCLYGIKRGMDKTTPVFLESFIYTARDGLFPDPVRLLHDQEIVILANEAETTVTLKSRPHTIDPMFYFEVSL